MPQARFVVSLPAGTWLGDLSAAHPEATFRLTTALEDDSRGVGLCWLTASDPDAVLGSLAERDDVTAVTVLHRTSTETALQFETDGQLTGTQYSLVVRAVELGYYDTPRECSLTDLAEAVGLAKSTVSETLHRAEGKLIKSVVGGETPPGCRQRGRPSLTEERDNLI